MYTLTCTHALATRIHTVILIDLQKAFDTVDYSILATQLKVISADRPSVSWFESYVLGNVNGRLCTTGIHLSFISVPWFKLLIVIFSYMQIILPCW